MFFRTALIAALISGASLSAAAADPTPERENDGAPGGALVIAAPDPLGDVLNGRGPDERTPLLAQFSVYASTGNRNGMEIVSHALREFGATCEEIEEFRAFAPLHRSLTPPVQEARQGW